MKANPGGQVAPSEVIGRDKLIESLWEILERQSLVLSAERRMGKTCIIKKMRTEAPPDKLPIFHDLEKVRSPIEFVETVLQDVEEYLSGLQRTARRTRQLLTQLSNVEVKGFKLPNVAAPHWKTLLTETIRDNEGTITEIINDCLIDPLNPWKMDYYRERIDNYYKDEQRLYALNLLDILAVTDQSLLFDDLFIRLRAEPETQSKEIARTVLRLLQRDYYIIQQSDRTFRFRYPLIQLYWKFLRG